MPMPVWSIVENLLSLSRSAILLFYCFGPKNCCSSHFTTYLLFVCHNRDLFVFLFFTILWIQNKRSSKFKNMTPFQPFFSVESIAEKIRAFLYLILLNRIWQCSSFFKYQLCNKLHINHLGHVQLFKAIVIVLMGCN